MSKYVSEHPGEDCIGFYKARLHLEHNAALAVLLQALGTSLIIYPACVYLCWTRLCGGGSRKGKADRILPACMCGARKSGGTAGFVETCISMSVCICVRVWETEMATIQLCQHELWSDLHRHIHKRFN